MTGAPIYRATFDEVKHARGTGEQGGQFVAGGGAAPASKGARPAPRGKRAGGKSAAGAVNLSFDGKRGTGYGKPGGDKRVKDLQEALNRLGLTDSAGNELKVDGKLGPKTTAAIKKAQRAMGLKADGVVTPALLAKLKASKKLTKSAPDKARPAKAATAKKAAAAAGVKAKKTANAAPPKKAAPPPAKKITPRKAMAAPARKASR